MFRCAGCFRVGKSGESCYCFHDEANGHSAPGGHHLRTQEYDWAPETADGCNGGLSSGAATEAESNVLKNLANYPDMRKLINGASIILILISIYVLLKTVFDAQQVKSTPATAVAATPPSSPNLLLASTTATPDPTPELTPTPTPVSTPTPKPLKSRVVKHQPDQFRKGAISKEELSAIKKAIKTIPWSRNSDPKAAADEDYTAIVKECEKSPVHDLLTDLITEAVSNDYQPNNQTANSAYFTELNSDFENGVKTDRKNQEAH